MDLKKIQEKHGKGRTTTNGEDSEKLRLLFVGIISEKKRNR